MELTIKPRLRAFVIEGISCGLTAVALAFGESWLLAVVPAYIALSCTLSILPGSSYIRLDEMRFTNCWNYRRRSFRWSQVGAFQAERDTKQGNAKRVSFDYTLSERGREPARLIGRIAGNDGPFLGRSYGGHSFEELAALLNEWRLRATSSEATQ